MRRLHSAAMAALIGFGGGVGGLTAGLPIPAHADAYFNVSVGFAPPPLPYYEQPPIPGPGYIWTPGYWAWDGDDEDYYWVPGTWVLAPEPGLLWTPAWWGWDEGVYLFHAGYWGPHVGFYGGIDYGFGYTGYGYEGGYWDHDRFFYNRTVNNITNVNITNVYNRTVIENRRTNISYNGGAGGVTARPTPSQLAAAREFHAAPTPMQQQHQRAAAVVPVLHASANHGLPPIAATARPAMMRGPGVVPAARVSPRGGEPSRNTAFDSRGVSPRTGPGQPRSAEASSGFSQRFDAPHSGQDRSNRAFSGRSAEPYASANRPAPTSPRDMAPRGAGAWPADRYAVPASAEPNRALEAHRYAPPDSVRPYGGYRAPPPAARESFAPPRAPQYAERRAPDAYGAGFEGARRAPPETAFRAPPREASQPRAAPPKPQSRDNSRREPPQ